MISVKKEEYLEMPWSMEDTIENLGILKKAFQEKVIDINLDGKGEQDKKEVAFDFDRAIEALEKQIPKKPKIIMIGCDVEWWCPNCGENHILMDAKKGFKYCHHCGQKLKWNG